MATRRERAQSFCCEARKERLLSQKILILIVNLTCPFCAA